VALPLGQRTLGIDLQLKNVFDKEYANFLSRYKTYALERQSTSRCRGMMSASRMAGSASG